LSTSSRRVAADGAQSKKGLSPTPMSKKTLYHYSKEDYEPQRLIHSQTLFALAKIPSTALMLLHLL
jgi:hypothetical protein